MSIGGLAKVTSSEETAGQNIIDAGVTFFISAGNDEIDTINDHYCGVNAFICVSALSDIDGKCGGAGPSLLRTDGRTQRDDVRALFSNWGSDVEIMAPGVNILSTLPGATSIGNPSGTLGSTAMGPTTEYIGGSEQGRYGLSSGTSMATPVAAGIGALLKSKNPGWSPATIKSTLQADAYPQNQACNGFGHGGLVQDNSPSSEEIIYAGNY